MSLRDQLTNLSPREQKLLTILAVVFGLLIFIGVPAYVYADLSAARGRNEEIRDLLDRMNRANELLALRRRERLALELRYARPAPALATFIETAASANGLEVPESTDRPNIEGKGFTERVTVVKMRSVGLKPLVKMLEKIERSGHPVAITQLQIKARASGPDSFDVQIGVSAYDKERAAESEGSQADGEGDEDEGGKAAPGPGGPAKKGRTL